MKAILFLATVFLFATIARAQTAAIKGKVTSGNIPVAYASIGLSGTGLGTITDRTGSFVIRDISEGTYTLRVSCVGYQSFTRKISFKSNDTITLNFVLNPNNNTLKRKKISSPMWKAASSTTCAV